MKNIVSQVIVGVLVTVIAAFATTAIKRHFGKRVHAQQAVGAIDRR